MHSPILSATVLALGLGLPIAAAAQTPEAPPRVVNGASFGAWTVACEAIAVNETVCVLSQRLVRGSDNAMLAEFLAFWDETGEMRLMVARVPVGVHFPSGMVLGTEDGTEIAAFEWQACDPRICEALLVLDTETMAAVAGTDGIVAAYRPLPGADPLAFRMQMDGLDAGLEALSRALFGRN